MRTTPSSFQKVAPMLAVLLFSILSAFPAWAAPKITAEGAKVTVDTDRYQMVLENLAVTSIENKLTGEKYASPGKAAGAAAKQLIAEQGVSIESLRPAVPVKRFAISEKTKISSKVEGGKAEITYVGLQYGTGKDAEFDDDMTISLSISVDAKTGDLIVTPEIKANIELVHGVRDRGVLRNSLEVLNLEDNLKIILPVADGVAFTAADVPKDWQKSPARFNWPMVWEAGLFIAESAKGCLGVWADDPKLNYGRHLSLASSQGRWDAAFEFETNDLIYLCDEIKGASWRLNVFKGYWVEAARSYQNQVMIGQWGMKPLSERTPAWADKIRIAIGSYTSAAGAELIPRDTAINFTSQGWLKGWNDGQIRAKNGNDYFPNWPLEYPTHFEAADNFPEQAAAIEKKGVHVFPYTNSTIIDATHPWMADKIHDRHFASWRIWQRFYPELCLDVVKKYGVSGIYEDCSWVMGRHSNNSPDGENWYSGDVRMHEYFNKLMPEIGVCGERNNEVTARGQHFALTITQYPEHAHPIGAFIFGPFIKVWNLQPSPAGMDPDDIRGFITTWPSWGLTPLQENGMTLKRGLYFAKEQLRSHWPEKWDPSAMHYFKGKDGAEYRFVRDHGTRFVKMRPDGGMDSIYWRLHGLQEVAAPGAGINGWVAYDGDKIIGMNPAVPFYVAENDVKRPPVIISSIPSGFAVQRSVVRDGCWLVSLAPLDQLKVLPSPELPAPKIEQSVQTLKVRSEKPVRFVGVESSKEISKGEYEVKALLPGAFAATWTEPVALKLDKAPQELGALPTTWSIHDRLSGLVYNTGKPDGAPSQLRPPAGEPPGQESTISWLLTLPAEKCRLEFVYGTEHGYGDGANYMVRVNGREIWKAYRRQTSENPEEAKAHKAPPVEKASVDLSAYAGQAIILELAVNGNQSGGSETISWLQPRIETSLPATK